MSKSRDVNSCNIPQNVNSINYTGHHGWQLIQTLKEALMILPITNYMRCSRRLWRPVKNSKTSNKISKGE